MLLVPWPAERALRSSALRITNSLWMTSGWSRCTNIELEKCNGCIQCPFGALWEFHDDAALDDGIARSRGVSVTGYMGDATHNHAVQHHKVHGGFLTASHASSSELPTDVNSEHWKVKWHGPRDTHDVHDGCSNLGVQTCSVRNSDYQRA